jgi:hypothetical protein
MQLLATHKKLDLEVYANFDLTAQVWELFADNHGEDYIGCADTISEARQVAREWFADRASW